MKAVILAAGEGTRLRPITYHIPKPMIPFFGKPFLAYTMENLIGLVDSIVMVVKYKKEQIMSYFGNRFASLPLEYVEQKDLRGTADALLAARDLLEERFLVIQGDVYASRQLLRDMKDMDGKNALSLVKVTDPENHAGIEHHHGVVKRTFAQSSWVDRGIWLLSPVIFDYIEGMKHRYEELRGLIAVGRMIEDGIEVKAYISHEPWVEIGDHAPLQSTLNALKFLHRLIGGRGDPSSVSLKTANCDISNSLLFGEGTLIESRIRNSVVYCDKTISGVTVINSIRAF